jgi:hypothetical protein
MLIIDKEGKDMETCTVCGYEIVKDARYPNGVRHIERHATMPHDAKGK